MITALKIKGFRGIAQGSLEGLAPLTVLVGPNNSGKSTVLESLLLAAPGANVEALEHVVQRRGAIGAESARAVAPSGVAQIQIQEDERNPLLEMRADSTGHIEALILPGGDRFAFTVTEDGSALGAGSPGKNARIIEVDSARRDPAELERMISWADLANRRTWLLEMLKPLLPGLKDLRILVPGRRPTVYVDDDTGVWPAAMAGDGFKRLLLMAARIASDESGLSLIEEPESFLHVGALPQVARLLWEASAGPRNQQIIATTHSLEYLDAQFLVATEEQLERSALFRLSLKRGELRATRVAGEKVRELRAEIGEDLRR